MSTPPRKILRPPYLDGRPHAPREGPGGFSPHQSRGGTAARSRRSSGSRVPGFATLSPPPLRAAPRSPRSTGRSGAPSSAASSSVLLNAAARATTFLSFGALGGADKLPLENTILIIGAWIPRARPYDAWACNSEGRRRSRSPCSSHWPASGGGARASAFALLFAHKILARLGQTSFIAYSLGGAAASLAYALLAALVGAETTLLSIVMEALSGLARAFSTGFLRRPSAAIPLHTRALRTILGLCPKPPRKASRSKAGKPELKPLGDHLASLLNPA